MDDPTGTFARRMRQERERAGLPQARLARQIGELLGVIVDPSAVTRIEKRERGVRLDEAVAIAEALGIGLSELLGDEDERERLLESKRQELSEARVRLDRAHGEVADLERAVRSLERELERGIEADDEEIRRDLAETLRVEQWPGID